MFHCPCCFHFGVPYGNNKIDELCSLFVQAGCRTWRTLKDSYNLGFDVREDSITDMLLLDMSRSTRLLVCKRYNPHQEHNKSGADWLWWFVSGREGFPILLQAKRLFRSSRYESLKYNKGSSTDQTETLIHYARQQGWLPLFCFYNYWGSFPPWQGGPGKYESPYWGCAVANAESVKRLLLSPMGNVNGITCVGPISVPWMCLVCPGIWPIAVEGNFPELVRRRTMQALNLSSAPSVRAVPNDVLSLLHMPANEANIPWEEEVDFLEGIVVVSDRSIGQ